MGSARVAWAEQVKPIHLEVVNFPQDASGGTFTIDEFAPLMERRAGCSYIFGQTSPIRHPIDMSENLHGSVVDEMGLQYHNQSDQAIAELVLAAAHQACNSRMGKPPVYLLNSSHAI